MRSVLSWRPLSKATAWRSSQIDLRVKGSSASFFSGHHKAMPQSRSGVIDAFRTCRGRFPERWEIDEIMRRLTKK